MRSVPRAYGALFPSTRWVEVERLYIVCQCLQNIARLPNPSLIPTAANPPRDSASTVGPALPKGSRTAPSAAVICPTISETGLLAGVGAKAVDRMLGPLSAGADEAGVRELQADEHGHAGPHIPSPAPPASPASPPLALELHRKRHRLDEHDRDLARDIALRGDRRHLPLA